MKTTYLDDTHTFEEFGFYHEYGTQLAKMPTITQNKITIPNKVGSWHFNDKLGDKTIAFNLICKEFDDLDKEIRLNRLVSFFLDDFGYPREVKFSLVREPDKHFYAKLSNVSESKVTMKTIRITLTFELTSPYRYSNATAEDLLWGSEVVTFENREYTLGSNGSGGTIRITGNTGEVWPEVNGLAVHPKITITGSGNNVKITCNKKNITVGTFSNQTIIIDTEMFISYINGNEQLIDMDDFYLIKNKSVSITGANMDFTIKFDYRDKYS